MTDTNLAIAAIPMIDPRTTEPHFLRDDVVTILTPGSEQEPWRRDTIDLEEYAAEPNRPRGAVTVHDAPSFVAAVAGRLDPDHRSTGLYADAAGLNFVAVLNDDSMGLAGWRDYRVNLSLKSTPEWDLWVGQEGLHAQERFAEIVEEGLAEIVDPAAAVMLDMAQTFHATTASKVKVGNRLRSGETQVVYEEQIDATAGTAGDIVIPETFTLALRPFLGAEKYQVQARVRFRLTQGKLQIGYKLNRPDDVKRAAFAEVVAAVSQGLNLTALAGVAPAER